MAAQNCHFATSGAYTGEISPHMVREFGCKYVILGHSERRQLFAETNELIAKKFHAAYEAGVKPILCIGEKLAERESRQTLQVIDQQLDEVINLVGVQIFAEAIIAYEPVWAIGTGVSATPTQAEEVHSYIRTKLAKHSATIAAQTRILYGGSVTAKNGEELFNQPNIDGGLIGGASLKADEFIAICRYAETKVMA
jgi:triosephosphate isomerase